MDAMIQMNEDQKKLVEENLSLVAQTIARHIRYNETKEGHFQIRWGEQLIA